MTRASLQEIETALIAIAKEAGALTLRGWGMAPRTESKLSVSDLVTEYDTQADALIRTRLEAQFPDVPVIAEESGGVYAGGLAFFVDPIDGTTNFAHGHPFYCISIGLVERLPDRDQARVGVVHAPAMHSTWSGVVADEGRQARHNATSIQVSKVAALSQAMLATGFPYDRKTNPNNNYRAYCELDAETHSVRRCGAAALELALVGAGAYEGYWDIRLKPWDLAAGAAIIEAAGGRVTSLRGTAFRIDEGSVLATNGFTHEALVARLRGFQD